MTSPEVATVSVVEHAAGIRAGCLACRRVIAEGRFAIGVEIGTFEYLVGRDPPAAHCGEEKKVPLLFDNQAEAEQARDEVAEIIARDGTTESLKLIAAPPFISGTTH